MDANQDKISADQQVMYDELNAYEIKMAKMREYRSMISITFLFLIITTPSAIFLFNANVKYALIALDSFLVVLLIGTLVWYDQMRKYRKISDKMKSLTDKMSCDIKKEERK